MIRPAKGAACFFFDTCLWRFYRFLVYCNNSIILASAVYHSDCFRKPNDQTESPQPMMKRAIRASLRVDAGGEGGDARTVCKIQCGPFTLCALVMPQANHAAQGTEVSPTSRFAEAQSICRTFWDFGYLSSDRQFPSSRILRQPRLASHLGHVRQPAAARQRKARCLPDDDRGALPPRRLLLLLVSLPFLPSALHSPRFVCRHASSSHHLAAVL